MAGKYLNDESIENRVQLEDTDGLVLRDTSGKVYFITPVQLAQGLPLGNGGIYTPSAFPESGDTVSQQEGFYQEINGVVSVKIIAIFAASDTTDRRIGFSLPPGHTSIFTNNLKVAGVVSGDRMSYGYVDADPVNNRANVLIKMEQSLVSRFITVSFSYKVVVE